MAATSTLIDKSEDPPKPGSSTTLDVVAIGGQPLRQASEMTKLRQVCRRALEGTVRVEELADRPASLPLGVSPVDHVFDDLEDAVEHLPGRIFTGAIDFESWERSHEYLTLALDSTLLDRHLAVGESFERLGECRTALLRVKHLKPTELSAAVERWFASEGQPTG